MTPAHFMPTADGAFEPTSFAGSHWGEDHLSGPAVVGLARLPVGEWIGVQADSHWATDGVAVGNATVFDQSGAFGSGMTTAVANPAAQIDFAASPFPLKIP